MSSILVVDDDQNLATVLKTLLTHNGNVVDVVNTATDAKAILEQRMFDLVITDLRVSNESGLEVIETVKTVAPDTEVIMITGYGSIDTAVEAIKSGAVDYLTKPFEDAELLMVVQKALNQKKMKSELKHLRKAFAENYSFDNIIGSSPAVRKIIDVIKQVAPQDINVLIWGESGTGKELFAKAIHNNSSRRDAKFVAINCSAMPDLLLESELFGHVKGAFTSAASNKKGLFEEANGGTVLLDEVGDTSPSMQAKLLRVLQEEEIRPVGSNQTCKTNVRVIAATNKSLESLVSEGKFREDLYYRLNVISINLPALSKRREDIIPLANHFLHKYCKHFNKPVKRLTEGACHDLINHEWPGNVRELENTIKRVVALSNVEVIDVNSLFLMKPLPKIEPTNGDKHGAVLSNISLIDMQREHILRSLKENKWNYSVTAGKLGIGRTTLWRKVKKYSIAKD
jgi:two-component system response regulator PilR (NtrC family)